MTILVGDCREKLRELADGSVHCCVTSPPYWGLRDYGVDGQLGLEPTPELYVAHLVEIFAEVKRVLRDDGVLFLNLGDSYATNPGNGRGGESVDGGLPHRSGQDKSRAGLKPKDLVGIPWRVAFALQADGWYLRSDIIWAKPNPMPESVRDRPTKAHEYIFLLAKSQRYYYDQDAIREAASGDSGFAAQRKKGKPQEKRYCAGNSDPKGGGFRGDGGFMDFQDNGGRNKRSVWTVSTKPFRGAHFATFPPDLIEPCILAGTSERGCCPKCGAQWERVVEIERKAKEEWRERTGPNARPGPIQSTPGVSHTPENFGRSITTLGWRPTCSCGVYTCATCGVVLEYSNSKWRSSTDGGTGMEEKADGGEGVQVVRGGISCECVGDREQNVLQQEVPRQVVGAESEYDKGQIHNSEGLHHALQARTPNGEQGGLHCRTQADYGETPGKAAEQVGSGAPRRREQGEQRPRESATNDEDEARQRDSQGQAVSSNLPTLRRKIPNPHQCPICGGVMSVVPFEPQPSVVLDCFFGAGTSGLVARKHSRDYIGIELNPEYAEMAEKRIVAELGMFADSPTPPAIGASDAERTGQSDRLTDGKERA